MELREEIEASDDAAKRFADSRTFDQLLALLRTDERAALLLHYRHELTHPEIADTLDLPLGSVKSLIRRAQLKLKEIHETGRVEEKK